MMAAQKEAGKMAQGKRTDLGLPETQVSKPTLKEVNIDKNLAKSARKALPVESQETPKLAPCGVRVAIVVFLSQGVAKRRSSTRSTRRRRHPKALTMII